MLWKDSDHLNVTKSGLIRCYKTKNLKQLMGNSLMIESFSNIRICIFIFTASLNYLFNARIQQNSTFLLKKITQHIVVNTKGLNITQKRWVSTQL